MPVWSLDGTAFHSAGFILVCMHVLVDPGAGLGRALVHAALLGLQRPWGFELDNMQ